MNTELIDRDFQKYYLKCKGHVEKRLASFIAGSEPRSVYDPIRYVFNTGGKRVRAVLVLLSCEAAGGNLRRALDAAVAIEILHNFTLVHDDVMDNASIRRGKPTVHHKWDTDVAILSGDEMIALGYKSLLNTDSASRHQALKIFTDAFVQVCEGQGLDKEFETRRKVTLQQYFNMIRKKTGRIIAAATELGATVGGGSPSLVTALRKFGEHLGRAFQLQDDLLDVSGNAIEFGKNIGGDIIAGKKTYLLLKALERARGNERALLNSVTSRNGKSATIVNRVRTMYENYGVLEETKLEITRSTRSAQRMLQKLPPSQARETLFWLSDRLLERNS